MIKNINDKYRQEILNNNDTPLNVLKYFEELDYRELSFVLGVILSDCYKILFFQDNSASKSLLKVFEYPINDLKKELFSNKDALIKYVDAIEQFSKTNFISKIMMMEMLEHAHKDFELSLINPLHILDKATYSFVYDYEAFKEYYLDFSNKVAEKKSRLVSEFITDKLYKLNVYNQEEYRKYVLMFLGHYYKFGICNLLGDSKRDMYIEMIEKDKIKDLYLKSEQDFDFLTSIIDSSLYNMTNNSSDKIDEVDKYFFENADYDVQKKLKMLKK